MRWQAAWWEGTLEEGNRRRHYSYHPTKTAAKDALTDVNARLKKGQPGLDTTMTFSEYAAVWVENTLPLRKASESTRRTYRNALKNQVLPTLGSKPLSVIRKTTCEGWLNAMTRKGQSGSSQRTAYTVAHLILESAVADRLIGVNPLKSVPRPSGAKKKPETPAVFGTEAVAYATATDGALRAAVLLCIGSGCRITEALTARWSDIDADGQWKIRGTKTARSKSTVPLPANVVTKLRVWKVEQATIRLASRDWSDEGLIVTNGTGGPSDYSAMRRRLFAAARRAKLPEINFHSFRHGVATDLLSRGVPLVEVAALLGHSPTVLLSVYAHLVPGKLESASERLGQGLVGL